MSKSLYLLTSDDMKKMSKVLYFIYWGERRRQRRCFEFIFIDLIGEIEEKQTLLIYIEIGSEKHLIVRCSFIQHILIQILVLVPTIFHTDIII